jgi:hypothetical protein
LGLLFLIGLGAWFALAVVTANQGEALRTLPDIIGGKRAEFEQLNSTKQYLTKWDKTLAPRSQAWSTMDFLLGLLPESKDVVWEKADYTIKEPNSKPTGGQAAAGTTGFVRQWTIDGSCDDRGRADLEHLREAATLTNVFSSAASRLNDPSFGISGKRTVKADLREEGNSLAGSTNAPVTLPYKFRLVVTQTFPANDPLALPVMSKPKKGAM